MNLFDVDYDSLIWQLMPVRLRKAIHYTWLRLLVSPVRWLYEQFIANRTKNLYLLTHNSQVVYLEKVLNDTFDMTNRGIYIVDGPFRDPLYTYLISEAKPVYLVLDSEVGGVFSPETLYNGGETTLVGVCFIVMVPSAVVYDMERMKATIDVYRLVGRGRYELAAY
jgi:hypothetical protein